MTSCCCWGSVGIGTGVAALERTALTTVSLSETLCSLMIVFTSSFTTSRTCDKRFSLKLKRDNQSQAINNPDSLHSSYYSLEFILQTFYKVVAGINFHTFN